MIIRNCIIYFTSKIFIEDLIKNITIILKLCNFFFILSLFVLIINLYLKNYFYYTYKKIKTHKYFIINFAFLVLIVYLVDVKNNFLYFVNNIYLKTGSKILNIFSIILSILWIISTLLMFIYNKFLFELLFNNIFFINFNHKILVFRLFTLLTMLLYVVWGFSFLKLNIITLILLSSATGIGFSVMIQKLFNNYISGLLVLFDKNFRIGDAININGYQGVITQINSRNTVLRNLDCSEVIVPNEKFLNEVVQNQSLYFSKGNLRINIQISFNNTYNKVLEILINSLSKVERVIRNPIPLSYITGFTSIGVDLELSFWILDAVRGVAIVKSEVFINILELFKNNNIELSYYKKYLKIM